MKGVPVTNRLKNPHQGASVDYVWVEAWILNIASRTKYNSTISCWQIGEGLVTFPSGIKSTVFTCSTVKRALSYTSLGEVIQIRLISGYLGAIGDGVMYENITS